jgi:hypothetical protein
MIDKIYDRSLLRELFDFCDKKRAEIIYYRCLIQKHPKIAAAINRKYGPFGRSDRVMAFGLSLMARYPIKKPS